MIEPDYDLKKVKGDSRRKSAVLAPEREVFSDRAEEDAVPCAQEQPAPLPASLPPPCRFPAASLPRIAAPALPPLTLALPPPATPWLGYRPKLGHRPYQEQPDGWHLTSMTLDVGEDRKRKAAERVKRASVMPTSLFGCATSTHTPLHPPAPPCAPLQPLKTPLQPRTPPYAPLQAQGPGLRRARAGHRRGACRGPCPRGAGGGGGGAGEGARCGEGQVREGSARKDEGAIAYCGHTHHAHANLPWPSLNPPRAPFRPSLPPLRPYSLQPPGPTLRSLRPLTALPQARPLLGIDKPGLSKALTRAIQAGLPRELLDQAAAKLPEASRPHIF